MRNKTFLALTMMLVLSGAIFIGGTNYALANPSPTNIPTFSTGPYPGAPSYTVYVNDSWYYAKNAYGVIKYSSTNATQIIMSVAQNYSHIYLKASKSNPILITSPIILTNKQFITFEGTAAFDEILWLANGANCDMWKVFGSCHQIEWIHLGMYGNIYGESVPCNGITFYGGGGTAKATDCHIEHCSIVWFTGHAIYIETELYASTITNNYLENCPNGSAIRAMNLLDSIVSNNIIWNTREAIWIDASLHNCQDNIISSNLIFNVTYQAIGIYSSTGDIVSDNWISYAGTIGIDIRNSNRIKVQGNHLNAITQHGIYLHTVNESTIEGNTLAGCSFYADNTYDGIWIGSAGSGVSGWNIISGNIITSENTMCNMKYGIDELAGFLADYNLFHGNIVRGADTQDIAIHGVHSKGYDNFNSTGYIP